MQKYKKHYIQSINIVFVVKDPKMEVFIMILKRVCHESVLAKIAIWLSNSYKSKNADFWTFDKQGEEQVTRQLTAGSIFAAYLINTLNRVENITIKPVIRKISVRDYHINRKGTSMKPVIYNNQSFCTFGGSEFQLLEFLQW